MFSAIVFNCASRNRAENIKMELGKAYAEVVKADKQFTKLIFKYCLKVQIRIS
jgi:hypothetical protein